MNDETKVGCLGAVNGIIQVVIIGVCILCPPLAIGYVGILFILWLFRSITGRSN